MHTIIKSHRNPVTNRVTVTCSCGRAINAEGKVAAKYAHADHAKEYGDPMQRMIQTLQGAS